MSVNTDSNASGGKASPQQPPRPVERNRVFSWASSFYDWARKTRIHPGAGLRGTQTEAGTILSVIPMDAPIGSVQATFADIYGEIATDGRQTDLLQRLRDRGWVPCDGATYTVAEFRDLAYFLGVDGTDVTFTVPDMRGRMPMGWDNRGTPAAHSDDYAVQGVGGYRRIGQTENNFHDHVFSLDLAHTHEVPVPEVQYICTEAATGDPPSCGSGTPTAVPVYTGTPPETTSSDFPATGDDYAPGQGTITRSGTGGVIATIRAKHLGDDGVSPNAGAGSELDDVDNRPPYMVVNWIIKAA